MMAARTTVFEFGYTKMKRLFRLSSSRRGTCICRFHLSQYMLCPLPAGVSSPQEPCNESVARTLRIPEVLPSLIHLMPRKEAAHALNRARRKPSPVLQITRTGDTNRSAATTELPMQPKTFSGIPRHIRRRNELYMLILFHNRHCGCQCRDLSSHCLAQRADSRLRAFF